MRRSLQRAWRWFWQAAPKAGVAGYAGRGFLRFFGKYSYAMYIFQNPLVPLMALIVTSNQLETATGSFVAGRVVYVLMMTLVTTLVALASWNLFEKHFLALKDILAPKTRAA